MPSRKPKTVRYTKADGTVVVYRYARSGKRERPESTAPTLDDLIVEYKASPAFTGLSTATRKSYAAIMDFIRTEVGHVEVAAVKRRNILGLRDAAQDTPARANKIVSTFAVLFNFAVDREYRQDNPAARIGRLATGEHRRWPDPAVDHALAHFPERWRRALILGLYTGQRPGDVVRIRWGEYDGQGIYVAQQKTGTKVWIPAHAELKAMLDAWGEDKTALTILTTSRGRPWQPMAFAVGFSQEVRKHAKLKGLVFHGLRKTAAARLAEAGCSVHEIAAITGHLSLAMVAHYTKEADQKSRASAAITKLENHRKAK